VCAHQTFAQNLAVRYDESEFIEALEVLPHDGPEGDGVSRIFDITREGLRLLVTVFQYDGDLAVSVYQEGCDIPIITRWARGFTRAGRTIDPSGAEALEVLWPLGIHSNATSNLAVQERLLIYLRPRIHIYLSFESD
jgi:hypothetical protein